MSSTTMSTKCYPKLYGLKFEDSLASDMIKLETETHKLSDMHVDVQIIIERLVDSIFIVDLRTSLVDDICKCSLRCETHPDNPS